MESRASVSGCRRNRILETANASIWSPPYAGCLQRLTRLNSTRSSMILPTQRMFFRLCSAIVRHVYSARHKRLNAERGELPLAL
jgi:hypothetical protein